MPARRSTTAGARRELAKAQDAAWKLESAARRGEVDALRDALRALARAGPCAAAAGAKHPVPDGPAETPEGPGSGGGGGGKGALPASAGGAPAPGAVDWLALDRVFDRAARCDTRGEVPSAFTCPLTMEVYRDPVTSKSGHTYERTALTEHLTKASSSGEARALRPVHLSGFPAYLGSRAHHSHTLPTRTPRTAGRRVGPHHARAHGAVRRAPQHSDAQRGGALLGGAPLGVARVLLAPAGQASSRTCLLCEAVLVLGFRRLQRV